MGLEVFLNLREMRVNFYNDSSRVKAPTPAQESQYRIGLANHLRPVLTQACGVGAAYRCNVS